MTSTTAAMKNDSNPETKGKLKETVKKVISTQKADSIVIRELKNLYSTRLLPIEKQYFFAKLHYPEILDSEMSAKPTVLLVGQYSTGKTSFIKNLLGMDYPDIHIGPEVLLPIRQLQKLVPIPSCEADSTAFNFSSQQQTDS